MEKKPWKSGGDFVRDANSNKLLFTKAQVMKQFKKTCKNHGWLGMTRFYVNDKIEYWTTSAC